MSREDAQQSHGARRGGWSRAALGVALTGLLAGCTTLYQPVSGLHRPVAIDLDVANFAGTVLELQCLPGPVLLDWDAEELCRKLAQLYENQGAEVHTRITEGKVPDLDGGGEEAEAAAPAVVAAPAQGGAGKLHLSLRISSRLLHDEKSWILPWMTKDYTFAQDVVVRDETGFLLVRDTLIGRLVKRMGFFGGAEDDLSRDFYRHMSQVAFNAKMRRQVLGEARPGVGGGGPP